MSAKGRTKQNGPLLPNTEVAQSQRTGLFLLFLFVLLLILLAVFLLFVVLLVLFLILRHGKLLQE